MQRDHPAFHAELAVARNRAWVPRIEELIRAGTRAFIALGVGHMVGPGRLGEQLEGVGIRLERC